MGADVRQVTVPVGKCTLPIPHMAIESECLSLSKVRLGLFGLSLHPVEEATRVIGNCVIRVECDGLGVVGDGAVNLSRFDVNPAPADVGRGKLRAEFDGLIEESAGGIWQPTPLGLRFLNDLQARFLP